MSWAQIASAPARKQTATHSPIEKATRPPPSVPKPTPQALPALGGAVIPKQRVVKCTKKNPPGTEECSECGTRFLCCNCGEHDHLLYRCPTRSQNEKWQKFQQQQKHQEQLNRSRRRFNRFSSSSSSSEDDEAKVCEECDQRGHWKYDCPKYLARQQREAEAYKIRQQARDAENQRNYKTFAKGFPAQHKTITNAVEIKQFLKSFHTFGTDLCLVSTPSSSIDIHLGHAHCVRSKYWEEMTTNQFVEFLAINGNFCSISHTTKPKRRPEDLALELCGLRIIRYSSDSKERDHYYTYNGVLYMTGRSDYHGSGEIEYSIMKLPELCDLYNKHIGREWGRDAHEETRTITRRVEIVYA